MPSLNLDLNYVDHPKTKRLVALVGLRGDIFPIRLWSHAGKFLRENGIFDGYSDAELEVLLGWDGPAGILIDALLKVGFLERHNKHLRINDWKEHEGHLVTYHKRAKRAAKTRWKDKCLEHESSNREAMPLQCSAVHGSTEQQNTSSEASAEPKKPHPYLAGLILYESDPKLNAIEKLTGEPRIQVLYRAWKVAFPNVDVMAQIKAAHAWELKQETKNRKTNRPKFLGSWIAKNSVDGGIFQHGAVTHDQKEKLEPMPGELKTLLSGLSKPMGKGAA